MNSTSFRFLCLALLAAGAFAIGLARPPARAADAPAPSTTAPAAAQPSAIPTTAPTLLDKDKKPYPPLDALANETGDAKAGAAVFRNAQGANCIRCHQIGDEGGNVGPPLSTVGQKLSKPQLLQKLFNPNSSILMTYEDWLVKTKDGDIFEGILAENTDDHVTIKDANGQYHDVPTDQIATKKQLKTTIMPEGLPSAMTRQDLVNLVEYLSTLRNKE